MPVMYVSITRITPFCSLCQAWHYGYFIVTRNKFAMSGDSFIMYEVQNLCLNSSPSLITDITRPRFRPNKLNSVHDFQDFQLKS